MINNRRVRKKIRKFKPEMYLHQAVSSPISNENNDQTSSSRAKDIRDYCITILCVAIIVLLNILGLLNLI